MAQAQHATISLPIHESSVETQFEEKVVQDHRKAIIDILHTKFVLNRSTTLFSIIASNNYITTLEPYKHSFSNCIHLQAGIDLVDYILASKCSPILASLGNSSRDIVVLDISWSFKNVDIKTSTHVPCNVAMQRPYTWVIRLELNDDVRWNWWPGGWNSRHLQDLSVTAGWVLWVGDGTVPCSGAFGEDLKIMAVKMLKVVRASSRYTEKRIELTIGCEARGK